MGCFASGITKRPSTRSCGWPVSLQYVHLFSALRSIVFTGWKKMKKKIYMRGKGWELIRMKWESVDLIRFQRFFLNVFHDSEYKGKQNKMRDQQSVWATEVIRLKWPKLCKLLSKKNFSLDCHFVLFFWRACLVICIGVKTNPARSLWKVYDWFAEDCKQGGT